MNSRPESKIGNTSRAVGGVDGDLLRHRSAIMRTETKSSQVIDMKKSRAKSITNMAGFEGCVVSAGREMTGKSSKQFSRTVKSSVRDKQIGKEVETTGLEVAGSMSGRSRRHGQLDCVGGATEGESGKSS